MTESRLVSSFVLDNLSDGISNGSFPATVLLADMTGFTRLTDQAMRHGDGGAEWISSILGALYSFTDNSAGGANCLEKAERLTVESTGQEGDVYEKLISLACKYADPVLEERMIQLADRFYRT